MDIEGIKALIRDSTIRWMLFMSMGLSLPMTSQGQASDPQDVFDWYYSAVFGTGIYRVGGRDVTMFRIPYRRIIWQNRNEDKLLQLSVPTTVGVYDFEVDGVTELRIQDVATATVFPGLYYHIPLNGHLTVKPFVHLGYGKEFAGGEEAYIYSVGMRSIAYLRPGNWHLALGNALYYAGNTRQGSSDLGFVGFEAALDSTYPTPWEYDHERLRAGFYIAYYDFSGLEFIQPESETVQISAQYELGLTLQTEQAVSVLGADLNRVGVGYLASDEFDAIRFVFSFDY